MTKMDLINRLSLSWSKSVPSTMRRRLIIAFAILAALLGTLIPLGLSLFFSWQATLAAKEKVLQHFAEESVERSERVFRETSAIFTKLAESRLSGCTDEHIRMMRELIYESGYIRELGYIRDGQVVCTSWGRLNEPIPELEPDFVMPDGTKIWFKLPTLFSHGTDMLVIRWEDHNMVIDRQHLVDVLTDSNLSALAELGVQRKYVLGTLNHPQLEPMQRFLDQGQSPDDQIYVAARSKSLPLAAVAGMPRGQLDTAWISQAVYALPIGLAFSLMSVALIVLLARQKLSLAAEIRTGLRQGEFLAYYQPLMDLAQCRCIGAEALIRWRRGGGEMVSPDIFIPVAESSGSIQAVTEFMIARVLADLRPLLEARPDLHIAVNLAAEDFLNERIEKTLSAALDGTLISPQQIWLEATERSFISAEAAKSAITRLRRMGHKIAIDDFGTGYSSLSYLQNLRVDVIKIDKTFIDVIGADAATSSVTPHIIEMAKSLNMEIVAEGVENEAQCRYLAERGVQYGQGWYFAKAMTREAFINYVEGGAARSRAGRANSIPEEAEN